MHWTHALQDALDSQHGTLDPYRMHYTPYKMHWNPYEMHCTPYTHVGHVHYVNNVAFVRPILTFVFLLISSTGSAGSDRDKY